MNDAPVRARSATAATWFLDVDGCLVTVGHPPRDPSVKDWNYRRYSVRVPELKDPLIVFCADELLLFIDQVIAMNALDILWVSRWRWNAQHHLAPVLGLPEFPVAALPEYHDLMDPKPIGDGRKWILEHTVRHALGASGRRFIWSTAALTTPVIKRLTADAVEGQGLFVPCETGTGLTPHHLRRIAKFVGGKYE